MRSTMLTAAVLACGLIVATSDTASAFHHRYGFQAYGYYYPGSPCVSGWNNPYGCGIQAMVQYPSCGPGCGGRYITNCYGVYKMHYHGGCPVLGAILHPFRHCRLARANAYGGYGCGAGGWNGCSFADCCGMGGCGGCGNGGCGYGDSGYLYGSCGGGCGGCGYGSCGAGGCGFGGCADGGCSVGGYGDGGCVGGGCETGGAPVYSDEGVPTETITPMPDQEALIFPRNANGSRIHLAGFQRGHTDGTQAFERGIEQYRGGSTQEALSAFQDATSAEPNNALYQYYQALVLYEMSGPEGANDSLQRAVSLEQQSKIENWGRRMERVQGQKRAWIEKARRQAGLVK